MPPRSDRHAPEPAPPTRRWPLAIVAALLVIQGVFTVATAFSEHSHQAWARVIPWPMWPAYADLRAVTEGLDDAAAGGDPLRLNAFAPRYNYPRIWLLGAKLGLRSGDTEWLGALETAAFLASVAGIAARAPGWGALLVGAAALSPPVWLGLERGNCDLAIFALVTPCLLMRPAGGWRGIAGPAIVFLAGMLKYFPIVCLPGLWRGAGRLRRIACAGAAAALVAWVSANRAEFLAVLAKTPQGSLLSYGAPVAGARLGLVAWAGDAAGQRRFMLEAAGIGALGAVASLLPGLARRLGSDSAGEEAGIRMFLAGAAIFEATFLCASNWSYRLVFLIWTMPLFAAWLASGRPLKAAMGACGACLCGALLGTVNLLGPACMAAQWASLGLMFLLPLASCALLRPRPAEGA